MNKYSKIAYQVKKEIENNLKIEIKIIGYTSSPWVGRSYPDDNTIKIPHPKSVISLATFLHELGHIIHKDIKPSCLQEYKCEQFAFNTIRKHGLKVKRKILNHSRWYIGMKLAMALNRGLKTIPSELKPYKKHLKKTSRGYWSKYYK